MSAVPLYEYRCQACRHKTTVLTRSLSETPQPVCEHCGGRELTRLVSTFTFVRPFGDSLDDIPDEAFDDVDESNPRELARWMRRVKGQMGETTPEFDQMIDSLEAGELPDEVAEGDGDGGDEGADEEPV